MTWNVGHDWCAYCGAIRFDPDDNMFCQPCWRALDITSKTTKLERETRSLVSLVTAYRRLGRLDRVRDAHFALQLLKREIRERRSNGERKS